LPSWCSARTWQRMLNCWYSGTRTWCCAATSVGSGTSRPTGPGSPLARLLPRSRWAEIYPVTARDAAGLAPQTGREQVRHEQAAGAGRPPTVRSIARLAVGLPLRPTITVRPGPGSTINVEGGPTPRNPETVTDLRYAPAGSTASSLLSGSPAANNGAPSSRAVRLASPSHAASSKAVGSSANGAASSRSRASSSRASSMDPPGIRFSY
jgi:hypothetical protein